MPKPHWKQPQLVRLDSRTAPSALGKCVGNYTLTSNNDQIHKRTRTPTPAQHQPDADEQTRCLHSRPSEIYLHISRQRKVFACMGAKTTFSRTASREFFLRHPPTLPSSQPI